jgi:tRNA-Thr(GGU) m(6)t(6)A37 methyltransferase TsaA
VINLSTGIKVAITNYSIFPVGKVQKAGDRCTLKILPEYREALSGLEGFSHVIVFYWFDKNDASESRAILKVHPRADETNPLTGVFATRSPFRPNIIGLSICKISSIQDCEIEVDDIDAADGSPIIDLKPYIPSSDRIDDAKVPEWVSRIKRE